jgi:hypothetical protein
MSELADGHTASVPPLFPPQWFVDRYNAGTPGQPYRTGTDALVMMAWHLVTEDRPASSLIVLTGI